MFKTMHLHSIDWDYVKVLKGWLIKKKNPKSMRLVSCDVERWFQVEQMDGPKREPALCYYKTKETSKDARGWIYLHDIQQLRDDGKTITIVSTGRTLEIEPKSRMEHKLWLEGLIYLCPNADQRDIMTVVTNKREVDAEKKKFDERAASAKEIVMAAEAAAAGGGPSPKKRKASSSGSVGSGGSGSSSRPLTTSRRTDHRLGSSSGRFGASNGSSSGSNSSSSSSSNSSSSNSSSAVGLSVETGQTDTEHSIGADVMQSLRALPSPERKVVGSSTTSRLHGHIRTADPSHGKVQDAGAVTSSRAKSSNKAAESKQIDEPIRPTEGSDERTIAREKVPQKSNNLPLHEPSRGEEKSGGKFRLPRGTAPRSSYSSTHLSSYSGGYVDGVDEDEDVIEMDEEDEANDVAPGKGGAGGSKGDKEETKGAAVRSDAKRSDEGTASRPMVGGESKADTRTDRAVNSGGADAKQSKDEADADAKDAIEAVGSRKVKARPPLPAPLQTKPPYVVPASLGQRLAVGGSSSGAGVGGGVGGTSDVLVPFSDQYSPSDALGHIDLHSARNGAGGGKSFVFPAATSSAAGAATMGNTVKADANFATANWDNDGSGVGGRQRGEVVKERGGPRPQSGIKPDDDWLNDNFDD